MRASTLTQEMATPVAKKRKRMHTPHDKLFKDYLKNVIVAEDFFEAYLPEKYKSFCDLSTLQLLDTAYIDTQEQTAHSDVAYRVNRFDGEGCVYLLIEHVSQAKPLIPAQILQYEACIVHQHLAQLRNQEDASVKIPIIIPIIFHRGKKPYQYSTELRDCFAPGSLLEAALSQSMQLIDLSVIPDEVLKTHKSVALLELVQKHVHHRHHGEKWAAQLKEWFIQDQLYDGIPLECFKKLIKYILSMSPREVLKEVLDTLEQATTDSEYLNTMQTITKQLRHEGREEGIQIGMEKGIERGIERGMQRGMQRSKYEIAKNMLLAGLTVAVICSTTHLSEEIVESLQAELVESQ